MNLVQKVLQFGADIALPVERVDPITKRVRLALCKACDRFDEDSGKCLECGCFMEVKTGAKTHRNPDKGMRVEVTHCPLGKWNDMKLAVFYHKN